MAPYNLDSDINCMWNLIVDCIRMVATEYLRGLNVDYLKQTVVIERIDGVIKMFLMKLRLRKIILSLSKRIRLRKTSGVV